MQKNSSNTNIRVRYKAVAKELKIAVNKWYANAEINLLNSRNNNSIYNYINKKLSSPAKLSYLINHDGNNITEDTMIAQELNNYFSSVYISDDGVITPFSQIANASEITSIHLTYSRL